VLDVFAYVLIVLYYIICAHMLYHCDMVRRAWWDWELFRWPSRLQSSFSL